MATKGKSYSSHEIVLFSIIGCTQAMRTMFIDESLNSSLRILNIGDEKEISLPNNWDRCTLNRAYTWYSECDDSRLSLAQKLDVIDNLFKLESGRQNYILQVRNRFGLGAQGRRSDRRGGVVPKEEGRGCPKGACDLLLLRATIK